MSHSPSPSSLSSPPSSSYHHITMSPCHQVRLNKKCYDERVFLDAGIQYLDASFPDGETPPEKILDLFLAACERTTGAIAVHCKVNVQFFLETRSSLLQEELEVVAGDGPRYQGSTLN